jgi:hypothetical protein
MQQPLKQLGLTQLEQALPMLFETARQVEQCQIAYEILNSWMRVARLRLNG